MAEDSKARVAKAMLAFEAKRLKASEPKTKRWNKRPEKEVEKKCLTWMRAKGWDVNIFEAKATYDPVRRIYRQQAMKAGTCDCLGNTGDGHSVAIEFKAFGKLSTYANPDNYKQQEFMEKKIQTGCFACVVDSVERLEMMYESWQHYKKLNPKSGCEYLMLQLPVRKKTSSKDDLSFD